MGQPKLSPDVLKLSARYPAGVLGNPKPIAQRFAHTADLRQSALRPAEPPRASPSEESRAAALSRDRSGRRAGRPDALAACRAYSRRAGSEPHSRSPLARPGQPAAIDAYGSPRSGADGESVGRAHGAGQDRSHSRRGCKLPDRHRWHRRRALAQRHRRKGPAARQQFLRGAPLWGQRMEPEAGSDRRFGPRSAGRTPMASSSLASHSSAPTTRS